MKKQNILKLSLASLVLASVFGLTAQAGTSNLIKTEREDFNAIIQEGLDSQKQLRKELRENAGMPQTERNWADDINETGRQLMGTVEAEQIVSPTTRFVRQKPVRPTLQERNQERVADEFESLELEH